VRWHEADNFCFAPNFNKTCIMFFLKNINLKNKKIKIYFSAAPSKR
jgi:hypothetical protein